MKVIVWYQPKRPEYLGRANYKKAVNVIKFCSICAGVLLTGLPAEATSGALDYNGIGSAVVIMLRIAAIGTIASYIAQALNQGQIASMLKVATVFSCLGIIITVIVDALNKIEKLNKIGSLLGG